MAGLPPTPPRAMRVALLVASAACAAAFVAPHVRPAAPAQRAGARRTVLGAAGRSKSYTILGAPAAAAAGGPGGAVEASRAGWGLVQFRFNDSSLAVTIGELQDEALSGGVGSWIWPGSIALALWVRGHQDLFQGKRVLELGSGCGLAGIVCGMCGAREMAMSDMSGVLCDHLRQQALRNERPELAPVSVYQWDWREAEATVPPQEFDVIIAADTLYYFHLAEPFWNMIRARLSPTTGRAYIVAGSRSGIHENVRRFSELAATRFDVTESTLRVQEVSGTTTTDLDFIFLELAPKDARGLVQARTAEVQV